MRKDIDTWLMFLENISGVASYRLVNQFKEFDLHLYTDCAGNANLGCGTVFGHHWPHLGWSDHLKASDIF